MLDCLMPAEPLHISRQVARRFILGRQGLWPGRRFTHPEGTAEAMRLVEHLQLDPLNMIARSQDLMLHARVTDYEPESWQEPAYGQRQFFDWGGWLAVRPMTELPYFRTYMRGAVTESRYSDWAQANQALLQEMRDIVRDTGPVSNRDFDMKSRQRVNSYRGRKDSALALFHLWNTGEIMIHGRDRFERIYDLTERIAPSELIAEKPAQDVDRFMMLKNVAFHGIRDNRGSFPVTGAYHAGPARALLLELTEAGQLQQVTVEGWRGPHYVLKKDLPQLDILAAGLIPEEWRPAGTDTLQEVTFLAPLDPVSARGRAERVFGFEYVWEVYKPVEKRRWGYYVLPILWDDQLVARADMKFERSSGTLQVLGFWLEDRATGQDGDFADAFGRGLGRLQRFVGADRLDLSAVKPVRLRNAALKAARL